jgi:hypothetical protein
MARQTHILSKERDDLSNRLAAASSKIVTLVRSASQVMDPSDEVFHTTTTTSARQVLEMFTHTHMLCISVGNVVIG